MVAGPHAYPNAEIYRGRTALLMRGGPTERDRAEGDLRRALKAAQQQEAFSLQLRTARDLASFLADEGERLQAYDLLYPVYSAFTEGFDTADLKEAKTLLEELP